MSKKRTVENVCRSVSGGYTCTPRHRCCVFRESVENRNSSSNTTCEVASSILNIEHTHTHTEFWSATSAAFCKCCIGKDANTDFMILLSTVTSKCFVCDLRAHVLSEGEGLCESNLAVKHGPKSHLYFQLCCVTSLMIRQSLCGSVCVRVVRERWAFPFTDDMAGQMPHPVNYWVTAHSEWTTIQCTHLKWCCVCIPVTDLCTGYAQLPETSSG